MAQLLTPKAAAAGLARTQAIAEVANMVRTEAYVLAYSDCFFIMGIGMMLPLWRSFWCRSRIGAKMPPRSSRLELLSEEMAIANSVEDELHGQRGEQDA